MSSSRHLLTTISFILSTCPARRLRCLATWPCFVPSKAAIKKQEDVDLVMLASRKQHPPSSYQDDDDSKFSKLTTKATGFDGPTNPYTSTELSGHPPAVTSIEKI
ncbi:hypothetical protein EDB89DRAFT_1908912 [Lactarius sanguifluus]|nr:hypothetical protein EDB89DRAFT_1908912 [Lactarius sanguifluus]